MKIDYVITNGKEFIRLNEYGQPVTCSANLMMRFDSKKANNILASLPRSMKKFNFKVKKIEKKVLEENNYVAPYEITRWVQKVDQYVSLRNEIKARQDELVSNLSIVDRKKLDVEHEIEISKLNAYNGWKKYKELQEVLIKRRHIKNEIDVLSTIMTTGLGNITTEQVQKVVDNLSKKKYAYRVLEEEEK